MSTTNAAEKAAAPGRRQRTKDRATEIADTFEWLITAFILAFVFRAFVMEAFRIPTGSMADTLMGAHFRMRCPQCGYRYNHGFIPGMYSDGRGRRLREDSIPEGRVKPPRTRCPSCGYYPSTGRALPVAHGDRILVLKCIYQFFEPKRWDVIVFKNPNQPNVNYIKRLVALPGETIEIIDGDVYIDGQISRKPAKVQEELWMPVYDNDYRPVNPGEPAFNNHSWRVPFDFSGSGWRVDAEHPTWFSLASAPEQVHTMRYDSSMGNDFRDTYAYNSVREYAYMPVCSDLMVRFYARPGGVPGRVGAGLSKYGIEYRGWVEPDGQMIISRLSEGREEVLARRRGGAPAPGKWTLVRFANVDHLLSLEFGSEKVVYDLGRGPLDAGRIRTEISPLVEISASGNVTLSHVAIFRDIHYTQGRAGRGGRAARGRPFELQADEFFVLGDNSPNSQDSRWWQSPGRANNGLYYRPGIVPRDYLVGKAVFVYWPSGFKPFDSFPVAVIPNVGRMRFIYGGAR